MNMNVYHQLVSLLLQYTSSRWMWETRGKRCTVSLSSRGKPSLKQLYSNRLSQLELLPTAASRLVVIADVLHIPTCFIMSYQTTVLLSVSVGCWWMRGTWDILAVNWLLNTSSFSSFTLFVWSAKVLLQELPKFYFLGLPDSPKLE